MRLFFSFVWIVILSGSAMAQVQVERIEYLNWPNCYRLSNGLVELVATSDVGPRIIHLSLAGQPNLFRVYDEMAGQSGGEEWRIYGGHRLWHAPEDRARTYSPDNSPVRVEQIEGGIRLTQPVEPDTGIEKVIEVTLSPHRPHAQVVHRLRNRNLWAVELAPWALSVMERGGFAVSPLPRKHHPDFLLPNRSITLWPYTDMRDERFDWGKDHVLVQQRRDRGPTKIGVYNDEGWLAYSLDSQLFLKRFQIVEGAAYPDFESSIEIYTNADMLEVETLGPLTRLEPGGEVSHLEEWEVHSIGPLDFSEEKVIERIVPVARKP